MRIPSAGAARRPRSLLLVTLLVATVGLAATLAFEAYRAARSHKLTAERLLRDYASFAAFEVLANAEKTLETTLASALGPATIVAGSPYEPLLAPATLSATADSALRCADSAGDSVRRYVRLGFGDGVLAVAPQPGPTSGARALLNPGLTPGVGDWLRDTVLTHYRAQYQAGSGYGVVVRGDVAVLYSIKFAPHRAPLAAYGIVTCASALGSQLFTQSRQRGPLLPASVTGGVPDDSLLSVQVRNPAGETVYALGPDVTSPFEARVKSPRLGGLEVDVALVPGAVERLAIAQPPSPLLPFLIGLLGLTAALATIAGIQLRREHELAQLRSDFVASVSHELRTPLAQILLFGETLALDRARSEPERRQAAQTIVDETRRLISMVENVLRLGRQPGGITSTPLTPIVQSVLAAFGPLAAQAGVTLKAETGDDVAAKGNAESVRQILLNLLDNAVKYGPRGQTVALGTVRSNGSVRLWVEDQGKGVPAAERERVFERFYRGQDGKVAGGTGLGLAVVRELAELQGGRAWVEEGQGGGARFVVELKAQ